MTHPFTDSMPDLNQLEAQRRVNTALVAYVRKVKRCQLLELYDIFGPEIDSPAARLAFKERLARLVRADLLQTGGRDDARYWESVPACDPALASSLVPARQNDVMHSPVYVPDAGPALRAGALDYKRVASVGDRC